MFAWQTFELRVTVPVRPDGKIPTALNRLLNNGDMSQNFAVCVGDVLVVPESQC
jgi:hypothetical protein